MCIDLSSVLQGRALAGINVVVENPVLEEHIEVPEQVEQVLEQLFVALQDRVFGLLKLSTLTF